MVVMGTGTVNTVTISMLIVGAVGFLTLGWLDAIRSTVRHLTGSYRGNGRTDPVDPGAGTGGGGGGGGSW